MSAALPLSMQEAPNWTLHSLVEALQRVASVRYSGPPARLVDAITGVRQDSRKIEPGEVFAARPGGRTDGRRFIEQALSRGAVAVIAPAGGESAAEATIEVVDGDVAAVLAHAAHLVYGQPFQKLTTVGITGTNGKTTTAHLLAAVLGAAGATTALIGTLGFQLGPVALSSPHTSPESDELARLAARAVKEGASHLVMEVSSIALAAQRMVGARFDAAALTNLSQDHLDYHGTMAAYAEAKASLFREMRPRGAVLNLNDDLGSQLFDELMQDENRRTLGFRCGDSTVGRSGDNVLVASNVRQSRAGLKAELAWGQTKHELSSRLIGEHNVENIMTALGLAELLGIDKRVAMDGIAAAPAVPGRLERCDDVDVDDITVVVDYAHTPDALRRALESLRALSANRLWCVFGAGGDRDSAKRPMMGRVAAEGADVAIVTNDNPRTEDPEAIADEILRGMTGDADRILDRRQAIRAAVLRAQPGDVVLIAGKGHETYQIMGDRTLSFDDRQEARHALTARRSEETSA